MASKRTAQMVARKHVNVMDRIEPAPARTVVPAFTVIDITGQEPRFTREKTRDSSYFTQEFNDFTLGDLVKNGLLGQ